MMITGYQVVIWSTVSGLTKNVNRLIKDGWEPIGGVARADGVYAQALVKREQPEWHLATLEEVQED